MIYAYVAVVKNSNIAAEKISNKAVENLGSFYDIKIGGKGTYADLEKTSNESEKIAVRGFLLLNVATNPTQVRRANASVAETVNLSRSRGFDTYGFMGIHQDCTDFAAELDAGVTMGLKGVKIHPDIQGVDIDDKCLLELYSLIEGKLPVYFHIGDDRPQYRFSSADKLVRVMRLFPRLEVIAAHFGGYLTWDDYVPLLRKMENIRFDTSSCLWAMPREKAETVISCLGSERIMFGTDYPICSVKYELERFLKLRITDGERDKILYKNAEEFLHGI